MQVGHRRHAGAQMDRCCLGWPGRCMRRPRGRTPHPVRGWRRCVRKAFNKGDLRGEMRRHGRCSHAKHSACCQDAPAAKQPVQKRGHGCRVGTACETSRGARASDLRWVVPVSLQSAWLHRGSLFWRGAGRQRPECLPAAGGAARHGGVVYLVETKARRVAFCPFKVVQQ